VRYEFLLEKLKIDEMEIMDDLTPYYNQVKSRYMQRSKIEESWGSVETYINALYWMKFVLKLSHYEMDELTKVKNFYKAYKDIGWNYNTFDYNECKIMHDKEMLRLKEIMDKYDPNSEIYNCQDYINKKANIILKQTSITRLVNNYGVTDLEELIKKMYFLVYKEMLNTSEIALIFGKDRLTVGKVIRLFNMNISRKEARRRIEKNGRGNHSQSAVEGKKVMLKQAIKNGITGSNSENICRALIETYLYTYFKPEEYEFLVGISSYTIVYPREIDIPVLIYERKTDKYYRYAIELDGSIWHKNSEESDKEKEEMIKNTNWKLIRIWFKAAERSKIKMEKGFRKMADEVCMIISSDIKGISEDWKIKYIEGF